MVFLRVDFRITIINSVSCSLGKNFVYSIQKQIGCQEKTLKPGMVMGPQQAGFLPIWVVWCLQTVIEKRTLFHRMNWLQFMANGDTFLFFA